jgi:hypothetical protein
MYNILKIYFLNLINFNYLLILELNYRVYNKYI